MNNEENFLVLQFYIICINKNVKYNNNDDF